jgi:hypothetical protein
VALLDGTTVFSTRTKLVNDFFAFPADAATLRNGAFVAIGDLNGDGYSDLIFGGVPHVFAIGGQTLIGGTIQDAFNNPLANFFVNGNASDRGGVRVATTDADQDSNADLVTGSGENAPARVRLYLGKNVTSAGEPPASADLPVFGGDPLPAGVNVG